MVNITVPQCNIQQMVWNHVVCRKQKTVSDLGRLCS